MKNPMIALLFTGAAAFAGPTSKEIIPPPPAPEPSLWQWFAGGSVGYLLDYEEVMYHGHVGVDTPYNWGGWRSSIFLEVGYAETDATTAIIDPSITAAVVTTPLVSSFSFMPVTLNFKLEREIAPRLNFYAGAGAGVAFTEFEAYANYVFLPDPYVSDNDEVFCAQIFAGLNYDVTDSFEIYSGLRWIYLEESSFGGVPGVATFDDDFLVEGGLRFNF